MKRNRVLKIILAILIIVLLFATGTGALNWFRVNRAQLPILTVPVTADDGGSGTYYGLGYSIEIRGNFMPEDPLPGVKHFSFYVFGMLVDSENFE